MLSIAKRREAVKSHINDSFQSIIAALEKHHQELLKKVDIFALTKSSPLQTQLECLNELVNDIECVLSTCSEASQEFSPTEFLAIKCTLSEVMNSSMKQVEENKLEAVSNDNTYCTLDPNSVLSAIKELSLCDPFHYSLVDINHKEGVGILNSGKCSLALDICDKTGKKTAIEEHVICAKVTDKSSSDVSEVSAMTEEQSSEELMMHVCFSKTAKSLEQFNNDLQDDYYDSLDPKIKVSPSLGVRAQAAKAELSDNEGLKYKIEEKNNEISELKKTIKIKAQEVEEVKVKVGLLEKKLEDADIECAWKVEKEKMETKRILTIMDLQEEKFNKAIIVLQRDIEALEEERDTLKQKIDNQLKTQIPIDISPLAESRSEQETVISNSALLLAQIDSLRKALNFSQDENIILKAQKAKAKLASLPRLNVPKRLLTTNKQQDDEKQDITDCTVLGKSVLKQTNSLLKDLSAVFCQNCVVDITKKDTSSARDVLAHKLSILIALKQKTNKLKEDTLQVLATSHQGGLVQSHLRPFVSPQFAKVLSEANAPSQLLARLWLPWPPQEKVTSSMKGSNKKLVLSASQFLALHTLVIT